MASTQGLDPRAKKALEEALAELKKQGIPTHINSGLRSHADQERLYANRAKNPYPVAKPGTSNHEKGLAADLNIPEQFRAQANSILSGKGWAWKGKKDRVHYDYKGGDVDAKLANIGSRSQQALDRFKQNVGGLVDPNAAAFVQSAPSEQQPDLVDPNAAAYVTQENALPTGPPSPPVPSKAARPPDKRGFLQRTGDYVGNWAHETFGDSGLNPYERLSSFIRPVPEGINALTAGGLNTVMQHTLNPVMAGTKRVLAAGNQGLQSILEKTITKASNVDLLVRADQIDNAIASGNASVDDLQWYNQNRFQIENARRPYFDTKDRIGGVVPRLNVDFDPAQARRDALTSMIRAYRGEPDPTMPRGGLASAAFFPQGVDKLNLSPLETGLVGASKDALSILDFWADMKSAGKFADTFFSPILGGAKSALGAEVAAKLASKEGAVGAAGRLMQKGAYGAARDLGDATVRGGFKWLKKSEGGQRVVSKLQSAVSAGEDFRKAQELYTRETAVKRATDTEHTRVTRMITDYSSKLAKSGVDVVGNALEGTKWEHPELAAKMTGNLVDQLTYLYNEAGGKASFFTEPEVLDIAAKRGIDPQMIVKIGDEAKALDLRAGENLVDAKLLDQKAFAENAGEHMRRIYWLTQLSKDEASVLAQEMAAKGQTDSTTFALIQNIAENGPSNKTTLSRGGLDPTKVVRERHLMTPEERLSYLPDLSYVRSSKIALGRQMQAAAQARILRQVADPALGMSMAQKLASETWKRQDILEQPRFKAELHKLKKQVATIEQQFKSPGKGLDAVQKSLIEGIGKAQEQVRHYGQAKVQHDITEPIKPDMPVPEPPAKPAPSKKAFSFGQLGSKINRTASERVGIEYAARQTAEGVGKSKVAIRSAIETAKLKQYAKDLSDWQKQKATWDKKAAGLDEQFQVAKAKLDKAVIEHDQHLQVIDRMNEEAGRLVRRQELVEGKRPPAIEDARDSLGQALKKVDPSGEYQMGPTLEAYWHKRWLDHWTKYNDDIFADVPPTGLPNVPGGVDPFIIKAMGENNPLIALALDEYLSVAEEMITPADAMAQGMTRWGDEYGPMAGRWSSRAVKDFLDDAMDPNRFMGQAAGPMAAVSKTLGETMRTLKLYTNPLTHMAVYVQSYFEGYATVKDAGGVFNPISYNKGMKEIGEYMYGKGPVTPTVQALLDAGIDMGGTHRTGVDPTIAPPQAAPIPGGGVIDKLKAAKGYAKQRFIDIQVFPKAGVTKILIDQGMNPVEAAQWAEKGYGGGGIVQGGLESPGILKLAEVMNKSGVAMFTSYPLHSMNRIMQLMVTKPEIAMQFPVLKQYLINQSSPEMQAEAQQDKLRGGEVPIPGNLPFGIGKLLANPDGTEPVMDISNLVAHGGALQFSAPNLLSPYQQYQQQVERTARSGLNPIDADTQNRSAFIKASFPGTISKAMALHAAMKGLDPNGSAVQAQTVPQALMSFAATPMRDIVTATDRMMAKTGLEVKKARRDFQVVLQHRMWKGLEVGEDLTEHPRVKNLDPAGLEAAMTSAKGQLGQLLSDDSITDKRALPMIRNQMSYIQALLSVGEKQHYRIQAFSQ